MRVGILTDYPSPAVQSGPAIHTRFLKGQLEKRGHSTVLMGPDTGSVVPVDGLETQLYRGVSYPTHPRTKVALPGSMKSMLRPPMVDVIHGQTNQHMIWYATWIRQMYQVPVLNTHTIHIPTHSHFLLSDRLWENPTVRSFLLKQADDVEQSFVRMYNLCDGLIVQSRHFVDYWRERGVSCPIDVVGRPIDPKTFSRQAGPDPFPRDFVAGKRMVVVSRHDREKRLEHLIELFARHIAPHDDEVTLTLVGDGHDHANLVDLAARLPHADRVFFPGESPHERLVDWYSHADLFVYSSLSETFGNVVNEALWCGLPVVALDDKMGVAHQVADGVNGFLVAPGRADTDERFAAACLALCNDRGMQQRMGEKAANLSRSTSHPEVVVDRFEAIYARAKEHVLRAVPEPLSERSRYQQGKALAHALGMWTWWNGILLTIAHTATRLGAGRSGGASQHDAVVERLRAHRECGPIVESALAA
jgi:1,2-diacylglycerol 3-alpha-glucosyltransferase